MKNDFNKVLVTCIVKARKRETSINVFDIMYETSLAYPELKDILDKLVLKNELAVIDLKTYKFTGDINRDIEALKPKPKEPSGKEQSSDKPRQRSFAEERRAYLEKRRQELIARMQAEMEEANTDDDEENSDNGDD